MNVVGVIPARFHSARLEGKPLALIGGRPMIQHVYERAAKSALLTDLLVATDDARIFDAVSRFGGKAVMTSPTHRSGTDRVAEATAQADADVVVNIQGDEPFISPRVIDQLVQPFHSESGVEMSTLMRPIDNDRDLQDPNVVKVVADQSGFALYFSRSLIPYPRNASPDHPAFEHIGLYAYTKTFLTEYSQMAPTRLERIEGLEQLRALENGRRIRVVETHDHLGLSVDTPADLARAERFLAQSPNL
ncbi:MAG: 3-deoxy-manno-octulosonate cytidylyltransferase [Acidobacteria bacterium]|nr:3-deoxy-manno-octulosonate cytidylyltransferase [Acidobacteriota bacterium]MDA1234225.1 3-deoxy-manno-octulosonate cytidylyltransferase [Acidobacteriota bacterium]